MTQKTILANIRKVFATGDIQKLSKESYNFIIMSMGHIAHYNLGGFQAEYRDLRLLCQNLQTSEYRDDPDYNLRWANELDRRGETERAETVRQVVAIVREYETDIRVRFDEAQQDRELAMARQLASKYGYILTTEAPL